YKALAAQVLGYVGEATKSQVEADKELRPGDEAGQNGVEAEYDQWLRGRPGTEEFRVDSLGNQRSDRIPTKSAVPGYAIRLTIDAKLQQAAERALRQGIDQAL